MMKKPPDIQSVLPQQQLNLDQPFPVGVSTNHIHKFLSKVPFIYYGSNSAKGRSILFNHFIDMRTTVNLSISCRKNVFLLENFNKNTFFLHEMNKLTVVLMSVKWLNKIERPLVLTRNGWNVTIAYCSHGDDGPPEGGRYTREGRIWLFLFGKIT